MPAERDLWEHHEQLRSRVNELEQKMAVAEERHSTVLEKLDESQRERRTQFETLLKEMKATRDEVVEARGAAKFGKWVVSILLALGVPPALFFWYSHGGGK